MQQPSPRFSIWQAEAAWGFPVLGGCLTRSPHVGLRARRQREGFHTQQVAGAEKRNHAAARKTVRMECDIAPARAHYRDRDIGPVVSIPPALPVMSK